MKLLSLELKNFRQHKNTSVAFKDGVTGILGNNGSGKSSLIEAISFALYGSKSIRGTLDEIRTRDEVSGAVLVVLSFEIDSQIYRVERSLSDAKFFVGAKLEVKGSRDVTSKVERVIGMSYEEFVSTFYTEQKGLEFLSRKKGGAERERFIMRLLGYDKLEKIQEKLRDKRRELKTTLSALEFADASEESLKEQISAETELLKVLMEKEGEIRNKLELSTQEQEAERKILERIGSGREEYLTLDKERKRLGGVLDEQRNSLKKDLKKDIRSSSVIQQELNDILSRIEVTEKEASALANKLSSMKAEIDLKRRDKNSKLEILQKRKKTILSLSKIEERCPTCGQTFDNLADAISHIEAEEEALNLIIIDEFPLVELSEREKTSRKELELLKKKEKELRIEISNSLEFERALEAQKQIEERIAQTEKLITEVEEKLKRLTFSEDKYAAQKARYEVVSSVVTNLRMERLKLEGSIKESQGKLDKIKEMLNRLSEQVQMRNKSREDLALLEQGDSVLSDFRSFLASSIKPRLCELTSEFLYELTDGRYREATFAEDFSPQIVDDGEVLSVMSGGEEDILHLSVRLALSQLLAERAGREFSLLILDEVFGSLDELRRSNLLVLLSGLTNRFEQIIVISHFEDVKDAVDHIIHIQVDERTGASEVKNIEPNIVVNI